MMPEQPVVGETGGSDLVTRRLKLLDEVDGRFVSGRGEPEDVVITAVVVDGLIFLHSELQAAFEVAVGGAEEAFAWPCQFFGGVDNIDGTLLKFHGVATGEHRRGNQFFREPDVAVVVDPDLGDDRAWVTGADRTAGNYYGFYHCSGFEGGGGS